MMKHGPSRTAAPFCLGPRRDVGRRGPKWQERACSQPNGLGHMATARSLKDNGTITMEKQTVGCRALLGLAVFLCAAASSATARLVTGVAPAAQQTGRAPERRGVTLRAATDKNVYGPGEPVRITLTVRNSGRQPLVLSFASAQRFDITATAQSAPPPGRPRRAAPAAPAAVWNWSHGQMFAQMLGTMELRPGQTQTWTARWDQRNNQGRPFPRGRCVLHARLTNVGGTNYSAPPVTIRLTGNRAGVDGPSDIGVRGRITRVQSLDDGAASNGVFGTVLVEGVKAPDTSVDRAVVSVTPATRLLLRRSEDTGVTDKPRAPSDSWTLPLAKRWRCDSLGRSGSRTRSRPRPPKLLCSRGAGRTAAVLSLLRQRRLLSKLVKLVLINQDAWAAAVAHSFSKRCQVHRTPPLRRSTGTPRFLSCTTFSNGAYRSPCRFPRTSNTLSWSTKKRCIFCYPSCLRAGESCRRRWLLPTWERRSDAYTGCWQSAPWRYPRGQWTGPIPSWKSRSCPCALA